MNIHFSESPYQFKFIIAALLSRWSDVDKQKMYILSETTYSFLKLMTTKMVNIWLYNIVL